MVSSLYEELSVADLSQSVGSTLLSKATGSANLAIAAPLAFGANPSTHIAFVDSRLDNVDALVAALPDAAVYLVGSDLVGSDLDAKDLDAKDSSLSAIAQILAQYRPEQVESIHIFSHGTSGALHLGDTTLTADNLTAYGEALSTWGQSRTGDILLYGCNIAAGERGSHFIEQLAALTGGDVQASTDLTGSAALGGDWDLEAVVGSVETSLAITPDGQLSYQGMLAGRTIISDGGGSAATLFIQEGNQFVTDVETEGDGDLTEGNGVFYSFNAGDDAHLFTIDSQTGVINFKTAPDYENPEDADGNNVYEANVLVTDQAGQADSQFLAIVVRDVAEGGSAPTITSGNGAGSIFKNVEEGTAYVLDMQASDLDGDTENGGGITYRINAGEDAALFNLNSKTGSLFFKERPDFETPTDSNGDRIYNLNVLATDSTGKSDSQFIQINVTDEDGDEPIVVSVIENKLPVTSLPTTDPIGRPIESYTLSGPDSALFEVVDNTLTFKQSPDFDKPIDADADNVYQFTLTALNNKNIAIVQTVSVTVEANQSAPEIVSDGGGNTATIFVDENTTFVTDVNVVSGNGDSEGNGLHYSFNAGEDTDRFNIDADTGIISFKVAPDFENPTDVGANNVYFVNVLLEDSDGQADTQFLSIVVKNVVESGTAPVITTGGFAKVIEGTALAMDIEVTDSEGDQEGSGITYRINAGEDANRFDIDTNTGELFFKTTPDFENAHDHDGNNIYRVNVIATDSTGLADSQFIQIEVTNKVSIYLLGGQSNMAGGGSHASDLTGAAANPLPNVKIWQKGVHDFIDLRPGFDSNYGDGDGFGAELGFGFALEAARLAGTADTEEIYLVKYAIGSTDLDADWDINGTNNTYSDFNQWVASALANLADAGIGYEMKGMLWMQGENDAFNSQQAAHYETNLTNFVADIRTRYSTGMDGADMDFVIGRLHDELPQGFSQDQVVRQAQSAVANNDDRNHLVNTDGFEVGVDSVHFTSAGHWALGEAFANIFLTSGVI